MEIPSGLWAAAAKKSEKKVNEDPHPLDAEIIGCTDDDEERDSGVDDDSDLEEEFVDRLIQKYL